MWIDISLIYCQSVFYAEDWGTNVASRISYYLIIKRLWPLHMPLLNSWSVSWSWLVLEGRGLRPCKFAGFVDLVGGGGECRILSGGNQKSIAWYSPQNCHFPGFTLPSDALFCKVYCCYTPLLWYFVAICPSNTSSIKVVIFISATQPRQPIPPQSLHLEKPLGNPPP